MDGWSDDVRRQDGREGQTYERLRTNKAGVIDGAREKYEVIENAGNKKRRKKGIEKKKEKMQGCFAKYLTICQI